nr:hypothetical protein [Tanacetum cinerariifolium]
MEITATICGRIKTITESSIRRHLKLEDSDGVTTLPSAKIFEQLALIGQANIEEGQEWFYLMIKKIWRILPNKGGTTKINENPSISLVQDEGTSWIQEDSEIQRRTIDDTEILLDQEEPNELVEDLGSGENGEK